MVPNFHPLLTQQLPSPTQTLRQVLQQRDFADIIKVLNQLTSKQGDDPGARAELIKLTLKKDQALSGEKDWESEMDSTLAGFEDGGDHVAREVSSLQMLRAASKETRTSVPHPQGTEYC